MQSLGGVKNSMLPGQLHRCGPQAPRNRQASGVPATPPFETPANLLYVVWNIGRPGHRRFSFTHTSERPTIATTASPSHAGLPKTHTGHGRWFERLLSELK